MIKKFLDNIRPNFEEGGKLSAFRSVFDGMETFLLVPNTTSRSGVSIHDAIDSKRIMSMVVIALMPALLFGMYNLGYQNYLAAGKLADASFWELFGYGFLLTLPKILVSYIVGLGIEFACRTGYVLNEKHHTGMVCTPFHPESGHRRPTRTCRAHSRGYIFLTEIEQAKDISKRKRNAQHGGKNEGRQSGTDSTDNKIP